jgi:short-subunit dehydrogenase
MSTKSGWAVVTGASSGLGVEFARQLAMRGHDVVLCARRRDRMEKLAADLERDFHVKTHVVESDLASPGAAAALLRALEERSIDPEVLINNAGVGFHGLAIDLPLENTMAMVQLNVMALTELTIAIAKKMAARGSGRICNVSSTASFQPNPYFAAYGATKAYVTSFSIALARELAPRGVRVLAHCPGPTRTEFNEAGGVHVGASDSLYMSAERCVRIALRALDGGRWVIVTGFMNFIGAFFSRRLPLWLITRITGRIMRPTKPTLALRP